MLADVILAHLKDLGYRVAVNRGADAFGMTAVGADGVVHIARADEGGAEAEERVSVELARLVGVDVEDG